MGQRCLPKELRTRKINSLPEDLKGIAEEIIAVKFDIKEEVVKKRSASATFQRYSKPSFGDYTVGIDMGFEADEIANGAINSAQMVSLRRVEPVVEKRIDFYSRRCIYSTPIVKADTYGFRDAVQRLDYANAPNRDRQATVSDGFARELMQHPDFQYYAQFRDDRHRGKRPKARYLATMFGVPIFVVPDAYCEMTA